MIGKHNKHGGRRPGAGRKRTPSNIIRDAIDFDAQNLPKYFVKLSELALRGDKEALQYLIDRHLGKPKQQTDLDIKGGEGIGLGALKVLIEGMARRKIELESLDRPLLGEGDATQ